uniref:Uncharacterized conserved protein, DUF697 family n=1 Tax=Candidatus Kentrum sp. LPFa TaxID=2126335 RepID=A0A450X340_9GAMM|nr:MAG: Uncharacterized conserved protein, DUF697 family [Candidatus Kentron sp. LPFa]
MNIDMTASPDEFAETVENVNSQNEIERLKRDNEVEKIIRHHVAASSAIGLIPIPLFDMAALVPVQVNLIRKIAKAYGVPFMKNKVRTIVTSLIGAVLPTTLTPTIVASLSKAIPVVGQTASVLTMPILAGAATHATGRVFVLHFESGGTFLNFNVEKAKERYAEMFKEGKEVAAEMKSDKNVASDAAAVG